VLTTKTILGAGWTVSSRLAGRLIDFVTVLVLARTLTPADFGLTALAMTLTVIVDTVLQVPLIQALTRLKCVGKSHLDTAFTLGILRSLLLSCIVLLTAWPFAHIYNDNRLLTLIAVLAIGPIARGLYSPGMVKYIRQMSFRQMFIGEILGKIIASVIAISIVYLGGGYWAIAATSVSAPLAITSISYLLVPYRPRFTLSRFSEFSTFLGWVSVAQFVSTLTWQFDRIVLGYFITKTDLGQYAMASDLADMPTQSLVGPAMQPVMAAFSRIVDDRERLRNAYLKASRFTMLVAAPTCVGMSLTSDLIVNVLLGAKWTEAAVYLQWIALGVVLNPFYQPVQNLALALNRTQVIFRLSLVELFLRVFLVSLGIHFYSLMGVIVARGVMSVIMFILSLLTAQYLVGTRVISELVNLWQAALASAAMALLVLMFRYEIGGTHLIAVLELILTSAFGVLVYIGSLFALGVRFNGTLKAS
jgi:Membrane protein involved in the export of O-antigen and teichoic acid